MRGVELPRVGKTVAHGLPARNTHRLRTSAMIFCNTKRNGLFGEIEMRKVTFSMLSIFLVLGLTSFVFTIPQDAPTKVDAAAQLPSIRACTVAELNIILEYVNDVNEQLNDFTAAIEAVDLDEMYDLGVAMHRDWYDNSPDIPYCAQGVHTRLLIDRMIEATVLAAITMYHGDFDLASEYAQMLGDTGQDLVTYSEILSSYGY